MTDAAGLLFVFTVSTAANLDELDRWYDTDHAPARLSLAGFRTARRYREVDPPTADPVTCLAYYDLDSPDVLHTPEYLAARDNPDEDERRVLGAAVHIDRLVYRRLPVPDCGETDESSICGPILESRLYDAPLDAEWAERVYPQLLLDLPGVLRLRRFQLCEGRGPAYLETVDVASLDAAENRGYRELGHQWRDRIGAANVHDERRFTLWRRFDDPARAAS